MSVSVAVHANNLDALNSALSTPCDGVRFGSEFCEYLMPTINEVEKACEGAEKKGKEFTYVTPRLSNRATEETRRQLALLNEKGEFNVVVNDLGALNIVMAYGNLRPILGRQLLRVPARSPWVQDGEWSPAVKERGSFLAKGWFNRVFGSTSIDYRRTVDFYRSSGVKGADFDWIPSIFPSLRRVVEREVTPYVHLHLVPVTVTRRCHTARFLGERDPEKCSRPCLKSHFLLKNEALDLSFILLGNAVFKLVQPQQDDLETLKENNVTSFVVSANPVTGMENRKKIDELIGSLKEGALRKK